MSQKVIPYGRQNITEEDIKTVVATLTSDFLTQGPQVLKFEKKFASYVDAEFAVAVSNATAGLHIATLSLGLQPGQRVITTPITFAASANCVRYVGGEVWFVDIDPDTYLISIPKLKKLIASKPKGFFSGIIPVDFAGLPVNMEKISQIAKSNDLWTVACHAPGAFFTDSTGKKIKAGSNLYSECTVFSFHPVKHIACGEGGMVTTNSEEIYRKLLSLRSHGITKDNMSKNDGGWYYEMQELGFNYRLTDIQAALGITQLAKNPKGVNRRNDIAKRYQKAFEGKVKCQLLPNDQLNAHHLFVIEVPKRKELYDFLRVHSIYAQIHYIPVHTLPYYKEIGYENADLSNAENYYEHCISLPMYPSLSDEEQSFVIQKVLEFTNE
jgi:UDP-4-amino-4,6-dideoxy-N-acetyl-beta-L-altrosamine transaminase